MAPEDRLEPPLHRGKVQGPDEQHGVRDVVGWVCRLQPVEKPEPLLGEGQRQSPVARHGPQRRCLHRPHFLAGRLDARCQPGDGRGLKHLAQRQLDLKGRADPREELGGQQRVASDLEKAVVDPDPLDSEQITPDPGQQLLGERARFYEARRVGELRLRRRQGLAVHLARERARQLLQDNETGRHEHVRQGSEQELSQSAGFDRVLQNQVCAERLHPVVVFTVHNCDVLDHLMRAQEVLDLTQLHPNAADLHLVVLAPEEFEAPVRQDPSKVSRTVQKVGGILGEGILDKDLRGHLRLAIITQ